MKTFEATLALAAVMFAPAAPLAQLRTNVEPQVTVAVPAESPLAEALRAAFDKGHPLLEELQVIVGPGGASGRRIIGVLKHPNIVLRKGDAGGDDKVRPGGGLAMEEFVISHEGFELAPAGGQFNQTDYEFLQRRAVLVAPDVETLLKSQLAPEPDSKIEQAATRPAVGDEETRMRKKPPSTSTPLQ